MSAARGAGARGLALFALVAQFGLLALDTGCRTPALTPGRALSPENPRVQARLEALADRAAARASLRATASVAVDAPDLRLRGRQRLAVRRPAHLRIEVLGLFAQLAVVLVTDGEVYALYDARAGDIERGRVTPGLLWQVVRVDLEPAQVARLLLGAVAPAPGLAVKSARLGPDGGLALRLANSEGAGRQRFDFDAAGQLIRFESAGVPGQRDVEAHYADYRDLDGQRFAFELDLRLPGLAGRVGIRFRDVELGPELSDDLFRLEIPERVSSGAGGGGD